MKRALLCVSFGTSVDAARESITAVENALQEEAPGLVFMRAFTSPTIRRILAGRGETVMSLTEALMGLEKLGFREVAVQPTHVLYGHEYDKLREEIFLLQPRFDSLKLGRPLLGDTDDMRQVAALLSEAYPPVEGENLIVFGHGTDHPGNAVYPAIQTAFRLAGREDILVGTVEGWPDYETVLAQLKAQQVKKVHLVPMMLVAGEHAVSDMNGDGDSWRTRLEAEGISVRCTVRGLGVMPGVQALYRDHLKEIL